MDAPASPEVDANINDVYALFLKIENTEFPTPYKQRNTVIKYTKLPEFDFESKGTWSKQSYTLQPRLRRIITLEDPGIQSTRSLKTMDPLFQSKAVTTAANKRKIVTISEDDEYDLHPKFSKDAKKTNSATSNRSVGTNLEKEKKQSPSTKTISRLTNSAKCVKENKIGAKINNASDKKDVTSRFHFKSKLLNQVSSETIKSRNTKDKDLGKKNKSVKLSRSSVSKNLVTPSESEQQMAIIKSKLYENVKSTTNTKKIYERPSRNKSPLGVNKNKTAFVIEMQKNNKTVPVIHVPLDENSHNQNVIETEIPSNSIQPTIVVYTNPDGTMDTNVVLHNDMNTGTEPLPKSVDQVTDMDGINSDILMKSVESRNIQTDLIHEMFDNLDIPNVSLKKDNCERKSKEEMHSNCESLPNLKIPELSIIDNRTQKTFHDTHYCKSTSYVISTATLTYRTRQKINFHVVGSNDNAYANQSPSPLAYPMNIVSVFKKDSSKERNDISLEESHESKPSKDLKNCINSIKSLDCSYVPNSDKLMKPSDIISTIRVNNSLSQSVYMCDQFQKELHFIDSFFESLQYLENCSLSDNCYKNEKIDCLVKNSALMDSEIDAKDSEYDSFLSKLENGANSDDSETMASKNLFLLNVLIRDEQRRAKNLLCVLKRREDALKDFAKSQIIYLEKKKKQDNIDISVLKKKQRGALVKLQHECGEMQRMRKALLTLSEKRKVALMKTKKDLELKLRNNVDVEQIILGKKKLKRTVVERPAVPLKCFDLSSSGCEDSTTSLQSSEGNVTPLAPPLDPVSSVEKCIQTGDSIYEKTLVSQSTDTADENSVVVDGGYLNILFHNLSLPQIFTSGKQYEVKEDGLRKFVDSTNSHTDNWNEMFDKLMDQVKNDDADKSSTPSTARSLVEEFEEYYRTLADDDKTPVPEEEFHNASDLVTSEAEIQISLGRTATEGLVQRSVSVMTVENDQDGIKASKTTEGAAECDLSIAQDVKEPVISPTGPLPIPAGAADVTELPVAEPPSHDSPKSSTFSESSSQALYELASSVSSLAQPTTAEAEELRRQELAIEREIKELEQQSRLLVVREIPDKPPPPYMPPIETPPPRQPRAFKLDDSTRSQIANYVAESIAQPYDPTDAFDTLVHDFCQETIERHKVHKSDKPWDSCNLLPQKSQLDLEGLVSTASSELRDALKAAPPTVVSGVSSRRSDHIDDILFAEWRRVEPEWTSLHTDEAIVKNQLFETIFQRILTETVDEYKRTVLSPEPD